MTTGSVFSLDAAEEANFEHYLLDFSIDHEIGLSALAISVITAVAARGHAADPEDYLEILTYQLARLRRLHVHLDRKKFRVKDYDLFRQKCRELAKSLLAQRV